MLKLHLVDLLSIRYTTNFAANTVTNRTDGAYALVYRNRVSTIEGETNRLVNRSVVRHRYY